MAIVLYLVLPISAAWLLGFGAALVSAGICLSILLIMALLEMNGWPMPLYFLGAPLGIWVIVVAAMVMAAVPIARILQIYKDALARLREYRGHLEELVEQRTVEVKAANQAKSAFLANMSHELRTPLNAILGYSTLVRDAPGLAEEHRKDLDIVNRSGEHLLNLIDDVLDMAKIEAGRVSGKCAFRREWPVVWHGGYDASTGQGEEHRTACGCVSSVPAFVRSDAAKLRQVLINLLGNAVKFTKQGSVILRVDAKPIDVAAAFC